MMRRLLCWLNVHHYDPNQLCTLGCLHCLDCGKYLSDETDEMLRAKMRKTE